MISSDMAAAKTNKNTYMIKVNKKCNTATVYKKTKVNGRNVYRPVRAIRVSCGRATTRSSTTPSGTFKMSEKQKWGLLYGNVWGRYSVRFYRDYLFHTVAYRSRGNLKSMYVGEYKKLGRKASAGCVRMSFIDEKWLSNTCPAGTKVIVYSSKKAGPLGKPKAVSFNKKAKVTANTRFYYDPTDPVKRHAVFPETDVLCQVQDI